MKNPKVSIVIPVYNGSNYLKAAIDSALSQTYKNIEIIVVNDGSKDNTEEIALSYGDKIRYYKKENGGVSTALNLAIKNMQGDYFSWLSHDDLYLSNKIETQIEYLNKTNMINSNVILYSNYLVIDENSEVLSERILNTEELNLKQEYSLLRSAVNGITLLIPRKAFEECGDFKEELRCTQDYELWFRMWGKYKFVHIPYTIAKTRVHRNQETNTNPRVLTEGNPLWIDMIKSISPKRQKELEGSSYNFYYKMAKLLGNMPYIDALKYCVNKLNDLDKTQKLNANDFIKLYNQKSTLIGKFKKTFISLKQIGLKRTIEKVKRYFMNRRLYK